MKRIALICIATYCSLSHAMHAPRHAHTHRHRSRRTHHTVLAFQFANPLFQQLGKEAQDSFGIPPALQSPIRLTPHSFFDACTTHEGIFINPTRMPSYPIGAIRFILFHEAVHKRYDDSLALSALMAQWRHPYIIEQIKIRKENRADILAAAGCGCEICLLETATIRQDIALRYAYAAQSTPLVAPAITPQGYLSYWGLVHLAHCSAGKRCRWHSHVP